MPDYLTLSEAEYLALSEEEYLALEEEGSASVAVVPIFHLIGASE